MTGRRTAIAFALILLGLLAVSIWTADPARSENYGGVSSVYATRMSRYVHAWFDKHGVGDRMVCVMDRESGRNPRAYNDNDANIGESVAGLFQVKWPLWTANNPRAPRSIKRFWHYRHVTWAGFRERLADPVQSIRLAYVLYRHAGLGPWMGPGGC